MELLVALHAASDFGCLRSEAVLGLACSKMLHVFEVCSGKQIIAQEFGPFEHLQET